MTTAALPVLRFELLRLRRNVPAVFFAVVFPVAMQIFFGLVFRSATTGPGANAAFEGRSSATATLPGYLGLVTAVTGLVSLPLGLAEYRDRGVLRRFRTSPLNPRDLLFGQAAANFSLSLIGVLLCAVVGLVALGADSPHNPALAVAAVGLSFGAMYSVGLLVAAATSSERAAVAAANAVYFPMIFISGATVPLEVLPSGVQSAARFVPLGAAVSLIRYAWFGGDGLGSLTVEIVVLMATIVVGLVAAVKVFRWSA